MFILCGFKSFRECWRKLFENIYGIFCQCLCCKDKEVNDDVDYYEDESVFFVQCYDASNPLTAKMGAIRSLERQIKYFDKKGESDKVE